MRKMLQADGEHVKSWTIYSVEYCSISVKYCTHNLLLYIMQGQRVAQKIFDYCAAVPQAGKVLFSFVKYR